MAKRPTFERACAKYLQRFTMEHVPQWARLRPCEQGGTETRYYAPQFISDREWYDNTTFEGEPGHLSMKGDCYTTGQTWPLGRWLEYPFQKGKPVALKPPKPSYDELLEMLDNVSAALEGAMLRHGADMMDADRIARGRLVEAARACCDALLRGDEDEDDNPFHPESPEGRAYDRPDSDWIALARDAGYDGSPGGEKEWCIGNGIWPR